MNKLINDLALTYRLKNGVNHVRLVEKEIGALLSESVLRATSHPIYKGRQVNCPLIPIFVEVFPHGFDRMVDNIVVNGLLHNPSITKMEIELLTLPNNGWQIDFKDDGNGMDEQTIERLFDRYYRGTSTERTV